MPVYIRNNFGFCDKKFFLFGMSAAVLFMLISELTDAKAQALQFIGLPKSQVDGRIPTLNRMGWVINSSDPYSKDFIEFSVTSPLPSLEIGAAYGFTVMKALKKGAKIIANDVHAEHLNILKKNVPAQYRDALQLKAGKFPEELVFESGSLGAILVSRVFHFFTPEELQESARIMFQWLAPGGKIFIVVDSPYLKPWERFIPTYEARKKAGVIYPGVVMNPKNYNSVSIPYLPPYLHFFDPDSLSQPFQEAGFIIEKVGFFRRQDYPAQVQLDGREGVGLIGTKPESRP